MKLYKIQSIIVSLLFLCTGCLSLDTPMPLAYPVAEGESVSGVSYHYITRQDEDILTHRLKKDYFSDFNRSLPFYNLSLHRRQGLANAWDIGTSLSFFNIAVDAKYAFLHTKRWHFAQSLQAGYSIFEFDSSLLRLTPMLHATYEVESNLNFYLNPFYTFFPMRNPGSQYTGFSLGVVYGQKRALGLEYTYQRNSNKSLNLAYEQIKLNYFRDLSPLEGRKPMQDELDLSFEAGLVPIPTLGLVQDFNWGELFANIGQTPLVEKGFEQGLHSVLIMGGRKVWQDLFSFGISRNEHRFNLLVDGRWTQGLTTGYFLEASLLTRFSDYTIVWLRYYEPLPFLPTSLKVLDDQTQDNYNRVHSYLWRFQRLPSFSFFNLQVAF